MALRVKRSSAFRRGFSLLELLVVVSIIAVLAALLFSAMGSMKKKVGTADAEQMMSKLTMALEQYRQDFNAYPPDNIPSNNGSEMIWFYLGRVLKGDEAGNTHCGSYMPINENQLTSSGSSGAMKKFLSPMGGEYQYKLLIDSDGKTRSYILIDPGWDKETGGTIDPAAGFSVTNANLAKDNIYSSVQNQAAKKQKVKSLEFNGSPARIAFAEPTRQGNDTDEK